MNGTGLYSDVVLPAATWYEKHDISSTDLHPFVHSFNPAIAPPWEARSDWDAFRAIAAGVLAPGRAAPRRPPRPRRGAAPARHPRRARPAARRGARLARGRVRAGPRQDDAEADRGRARLRRRGGEVGALGPLVESSARPKGALWVPDRRSRRCAAETASSRRRRRRRPSLERVDRPARRSWRSRAPPTAASRSRASARSRGAPACRSPTSPPSTPTSGSASATRIQPRKVITSAEWSGIESRERRYSPFTINVDARCPGAR